MIEVEIPKDIRQYDAKLIGPFTTRQTICFVAGAILTVPTYLAIKEILPTDACLFISLCIFTPFLLCGWVKVYGLTFEEFFKAFMYSTVLAPKNRKYKTENIYDIPENKIEDNTEENTKMTKKEKRKIEKERKKKVKKSKNPELQGYL